ncbi:MAG: hypothetical protein E6Q94_01675 [Burkholderiaceae bacterium]|nr:MAG: hypothetical protein E6Q94_01675 [Burkholderiaceae bacterium]
MKSAVIKRAQAPAQEQLTLSFEPGLSDRYGSLRECVATGVYQRGLKRVAIDLDQAPSNLSVQLSDDPSRHFSVDNLERYIERTTDLTPVYYLVEKFIKPRDGRQEAALAQLPALAEQLQAVLKQAGMA